MSSDPHLLSKLTRIGATASEVVELFDFVPDALIWLKDWDGHYQWVNVAFCLNFGVQSRAEVIGRTDFDLCSLALAHQYRIEDERVLAGERIISRHELVGRFDHTVRWCVTSKLPVHDAQGKVVGTAGVTRPLQEQKQGAPADSPLSGAIHYVSQHYSDSLTNKDLAKACGLSVRAFERQFRATYHSSPHDYVRKVRVRMTCNALYFTKKSLAEIAGEFGFADQSHFTKEFRRIMKETPRAYRARTQA